MLNIANRPAAATHMNDAGEYFKYGLHGLLYRYDRDVNDWLRAQPRKRLRTIVDQIAEDQKPESKRTYRNRNY
jgi:hypothetical protein